MSNYVTMPYQQNHKLLWSEGDTEIRLESAVRIADEMDSLQKEHWLEVANYKDTVPLDPRYEDIFRLEREGSIALLTLRERGKLIGYSMFITRVHLHYRSLIVADNDIIFVSSEKRHQKFGLQLILESERAVKAMGASKITWHMKPHKSFAHILEQLGYTHEEMIYGRLL